MARQPPQDAPLPMTESFEQDPAYFLRRVADHVPSMLAYWDKDLRCRFANRAYERWFGVDPDALVGRSIRELLGPQLFALNEPHIRAVLSGEPQTFERLVPGADGIDRHSLAHYLPDVVDGEVRGFSVQVTEVTALKAAEAVLREAEERLRASEHFLDRTGRIAGVGGWEVDLSTQRVTWSSHTRRIHEVDDDYVPVFLGQRAFYAPEGWAQLDAAVRAALQDGTSWDLELPFITARQRRLWVRSFGEVDYEDGVAVRLVGAFQDITEHKQHKAQLRHEQELRLETERHAAALSQLLKERGEMLDVLAHEVRQPLNNASAALQGAAATMSGIDDEVAAGRLLRVQAVIGQVQASIDNTLTVASLLARPEPICPTDTDIDTLLAVAIADMPAGERRRVVIDRATTTRTASMDMSLMRLALRNLLSNALRYSPLDMPVVVRMSDSDDPLALIIEVEDAGSGVPAEAVPRLFERATHKRADLAPPHGLGLGLYIVRRVMDLHGGRAELVRNGAAGATFRLLVTQHADG